MRKTKSGNKKNGYKSSISKRLIISFTLIIAVISISLTSLVLVISKKAMMESIGENYTKILKLSSDMVNEQMIKKMNTIENLAMDEEISDSKIDNKFKANILQKYAKNNGFIRIGVSDLNGKTTFNDFEGNIQGSDYLKSALDGKTVMSNPIENLNLKDSEKLVVVYATPIKENNKIIGAIIAVTDTKKLSDIANSIEIGSTGEIMIFDNDGKLIAQNNKNKSEILINNIKEEAKKSNNYTEIYNKVISNENGYVRAKIDNNKVFVAYGPIKNTDWHMIIGIEEVEILANIVMMRNMMGILLISLLAIGVLTIFVQTKRMTNSLVKTEKHLDVIANGDMTQEVDLEILERRDELGSIGKSLQVMQKSIIEIVSGVRGVSIDVNKYSDNLASLAEEMSSSADTVAGSIQDVAKGTDDQSREIVQIVEILNYFNEQLEEVKNITNDVATENQNIYLMSKDSNLDMEKVVKSVENVKQSFRNLEVKVNLVSENINKIGVITNAINDIAEQTNLLALNAAIEAARAGDVGRGFAVVAEEIRKLAEESKSSSKNITLLLDKISKGTIDMVKTTAVVKEEVSIQIETVGNAINSFSDINSAVEKMKPKIERNIQVEMEIQKGKDEIITRIQNASAVSEEVSASAEEIAAISEEMNASSQNVAESARELLNMMKILKENIEKFKID